MSTCEITGNILLGSGNPLDGAYIYAVPYDSPAVISGTESALSAEPIVVLSSSTGAFTIELMQNVRFTIIIPEIGFKKTIVVPELSTAVLWGLSDIFVTGESGTGDSGDNDW